MASFDPVRVRKKGNWDWGRCRADDLFFLVGLSFGNFHNMDDSCLFLPIDVLALTVGVDWPL